MKLEICKRWDILISDKNPKIWEIELDSELTTIWYNEMMRRFIKETQEDKYTVIPLYDVDEAYECGQISLWHLKDMLTFLNNI